MMIQLTKWLNQYYPDLTLSLGLYYSNYPTVRFDLSQWMGDISYLEDTSGLITKEGFLDFEKFEEQKAIHSAEIAKVRQKHLNQACERAMAILNALFYLEGKCLLVIQNYQSYLAEDIKKLTGCFPESYLSDGYKEATLFPYNDEDMIEELKPWERMTWKILAHGIKFKKLIELIIYQDYSNEGESFPHKSDIFFIEPIQQVICNIYDDRGMDVLGNKMVVGDLRQKFNQWVCKELE